MASNEADQQRPKVPFLGEIKAFRKRIKIRKVVASTDNNDASSTHTNRKRDDQASNIFASHHLDDQLCTEMNVLKCKSVQRLAFVLKQYQNVMHESGFNEQQTEKQETNDDEHKTSIDLSFINHEFGDNYGVLNILNDHIHCIIKHNENLEDIYNFINIKCDLSKCKGIKRNHRDRSKANIVDNASNMSMVDILDQIHCNILHTFDVGFQLTLNEKQQINEHKNKDDDDDEKDIIQTEDKQYRVMKEILTEKRKRYTFCGGLQRIQLSKFVTKVNDNEESEENDEESKSMDTTQTSQENNTLYSVGHRFYYWKHYENNTKLDWSNPGYKFCDFYIHPKYTNIKEEILNNSACEITKKQWNVMHAKVIQYMNSSYCKHMRLKPHRFTEYEVHLSDTLSLNHLLSLLFYTDFTVLSYAFSASFRACDKVESISDLKQRHSHYYWWAKTLRETVEFYGNDINESKGKCFWHGVSQRMIFKSTVSTFNCPTSTTTQIAVASTFARDNGIILQLSSFYKVGSGGYYFNCSCLSAFSNECEMLFIGGYWPLSTVNILNCATGKNYGAYLHALNILIAAMSGMPLSTEEQQAKKMDKRVILKLLTSNNDSKILKRFDPYFLEIYNAFRRNTKYLYLDLFYLSSDYTKSLNVVYVGNDIDYYGYEFLCDLLLTKAGDAINSFVKLNVIMRNFPNCKRIRLYYNGGFNEKISISKTYLQQICDEFTEMQHNNALESIEIKNTKLSSNKLLSDFKSQFEKFNRKIWWKDDAVNRGSFCVDVL